MKRFLSIILFILIILVIGYYINAVFYSDTKNMQNNKLPATNKNTRSNYGKVTITTVYDNYAYQDDFDTGWGFSCLVEQIQIDGEKSKIILFDTGADGDTLVANMNKLGIDMKKIHSVFISHRHSDHTGGLNKMLRIMPEIPVLYPEDYSQSEQLFDRAWTTGKIGSSPEEHSLVLQTEKGLVIICGCAHPGVDNIIKKTIKFFPSQKIYLVMGGFHLKDSKKDEIEKIISYFQQTGVMKVAPSHCTGENALEMFQKAFQDDYIENGVGRKIDI